MTYEEAIEKMAASLASETDRDEPRHWMFTARAAAEAIGLREMMEALKPFAKRGAYIDEHCPNAPDNDETGVDLGELRRAALSTEPRP
jgi:hypothetical protein